MPCHLRAACTDSRVLRPGESLADVPAHPWREAAIPVDDDTQLLARVPLQTGWTAAADLAANGAGRLALGLRGNHESAERPGSQKVMFDCGDDAWRPADLQVEIREAGVLRLEDPLTRGAARPASHKQDGETGHDSNTPHRVTEYHALGLPSLVPRRASVSRRRDRFRVPLHIGPRGQ